MSEIIVGTKLQSVKNGLTATVFEVNMKYKTAIIDFEDGTNKSYSLATLKDKRAWMIIDEQTEVVDTPDTEEVIEHEQMPVAINPNVIDMDLLSKFVKKAQRLITDLYRDYDGYHVTINVSGKNISYNDKNLQNIRSAIGHIYRGEVEV